MLFCPFSWQTYYLGLVQKFSTEIVFMESFNLKLNSFSFLLKGHLLSVEYSVPFVLVSCVPSKAHFDGNMPLRTLRGTQSGDPLKAQLNC